MKAEDILRLVASVGEAAAPMAAANPIASVVVGGVTAALHLAADLVAAGRDPVAAITRIRDAHEDLVGVEAEWTARLAARFPAPTMPAPDGTVEP